MNIKPTDRYVIPLYILGFMICMFTALSFTRGNIWLMMLVATVFYPLALNIHYMLGRDLEQYKREYFNDRQ